MTQLLERAFTQLKGLPDSEQDVIASVILDELDSERKWQELFDASPDLLAEMCREALAELRSGKTLPLDPDSL